MLQVLKIWISIHCLEFRVLDLELPACSEGFGTRLTRVLTVVQYGIESIRYAANNNKPSNLHSFFGY